MVSYTISWDEFNSLDKPPLSRIEDAEDLAGEPVAILIYEDADRRWVVETREDGVTVTDHSMDLLPPRKPEFF